MYHVSNQTLFVACACAKWLCHRPGLYIQHCLLLMFCTNIRTENMPFVLLFSRKCFGLQGIFQFCVMYIQYIIDILWCKRHADVVLGISWRRTAFYVINWKMFSNGIFHVILLVLLFIQGMNCWCWNLSVWFISVAVNNVVCFTCLFSLALSSFVFT